MSKTRLTDYLVANGEVGISAGRSKIASEILAKKIPAFVFIQARQGSSYESLLRDAVSGNYAREEEIELVSSRIHREELLKMALGQDVNIGILRGIWIDTDAVAALHGAADVVGATADLSVTQKWEPIPVPPKAQVMGELVIEVLNSLEKFPEQVTPKRLFSFVCKEADIGGFSLAKRKDPTNGSADIYRGNVKVTQQKIKDTLRYLRKSISDSRKS